MKTPRAYQGILLAGACCLVLLHGFQNCAPVGISKPAEVTILKARAQTDLCLQNDLQNYTLETFYVRNVNIVGWKGRFLVDSDADGLPDEVETSMGFDPLKARSRSSVLDRVCYNIGASNSCPGASTQCSSVPGPLGISECEVKTLGLDQVYQHPALGLDTDKDGIIDYFEILGGSSPIVSDALADPDNDGVLNQAEYARASNSIFSDAAADSDRLVDISARQLNGADAQSCAGEVWELKINHLPYLPSSAFVSTDPGVGQGHKAVENVVVAVIKLKPRTGLPGNSRVYFQTFVVTPDTKDLHLTIESLEKAGEVLP